MRDLKDRIPSTNYTARRVVQAPSSSSPKQRLRTYAWFGYVYKNIAVRLFAWLLFAGTAALMVYAVQTKDYDYARLAIVSCVLFIIFKALGYAGSQKIRCTLCHGTLLQSKSCSKHRDAKAFPLIGHARTTILNALLRGKCQCMYCGTWFRMRR